MNFDGTTVLEWTFKPTNLFEEIVDVEILAGSVHIEQGVARGHFPASEFARGRKFRDDAHRELEPYFMAQAIITGKQLVLHPARLSLEYPDGRTHQTMFAETGYVNISTFSVGVDFITRDKDGNVTADTRAERIAEQKEFRDKLVNALPKLREIHEMAASWNKSFKDEANCFVHLYEVRDRIRTKFSSEKEAKKALNVEDDWGTIGELCNAPDSAVSRHRGKGTNHKKPDQDTLRKCRNATRRLIAAYIDYASRS
jgi:hypothetical protein